MWEWLLSRCEGIHLSERELEAFQIHRSPRLSLYIRVALLHQQRLWGPLLLLLEWLCIERRHREPLCQSGCTGIQLFPQIQPSLNEMTLSKLWRATLLWMHHAMVSPIPYALVPRRAAMGAVSQLEGNGNPLELSCTVLSKKAYSIHFSVALYLKPAELP